jgi:cytochrome c556
MGENMKKTLAFAFASAFLASALPAMAADETNGVIVHRQGIYKSVSGHMHGLKSIVILKNGPKENLAYHAEGILAAYKHLGDAFPAGTDVGITKAKPNIWTERAKFDAAGKKSFEAASAMVEAAKSGKPDQAESAFKALGATCKACHDDFKKD